MVLVLAVPAMAQTDKTVSGKVVSSTSDQLVIQTDEGRQMTFKVDTQSTVPSALQAGNRVSVNYHELAGGNYHAASVSTTDMGTGATNPNPAYANPNANPNANPAYPSANTGTTPSTAQEPMREETGTKARRGTRRMPATASPLPLMGLAGLFALSAGLGVGIWRRKAA
ncbi:MAG: hypothetical protein DMF80_03000 [Acidobacteria bacterium]|nr:MAG: hypothetical protein DMF80_03000 [Acidobacteriota bacterium]PYQ24231.1 MAG: hypothetical protein DMF81_06110 [Acidobacteriota bacterium]